ncbi:MAG: transcriptional repressor [Acidimicrobiales bacterium]|jgi:Fe2+ or Zn2+ uptake regulation protein|nr:transcriptional repressor [Acidimicrobiales bacterium]
MSSLPGEADLHVTVAQRLRRDHQRYTPARRALVELLVGAGGPVSLPELLRRDVALAQSSTYRNLGVLEAVGVVHRVVVEGESARYELAEDLTEHHHHLICTRCGAVRDFTISPTLERSLARAFDQVSAETGFRPTHHRLDLIGRCERCA